MPSHTLQSSSLSRSLPATPTATPSSENQNRLWKVANDFEAIFVQMMLESMRKTLNPSARLIPQNTAERIFEDFLYEERAQEIAETQKIGLAEMIYQQYSRYTP